MGTSRSGTVRVPVIEKRVYEKYSVFKMIMRYFFRIWSEVFLYVLCRVVVALPLAESQC